MLAVGVVAAGCDASVKLVRSAAPPGPPATVTVVAVDTALAARAGWSHGVPRAAIFLRRNEDRTVILFTSGDSGVLSLHDLPAADYWAWARKDGDSAELAAPVLAPKVLGGGRRISLFPGVADRIELRGHDNGSLVISEFYYQVPPISVFGEGVNYQFHWYIELYNNADTTIYLDGMTVGAGFEYHLDAELWPCQETEPFRDDPRGVWSQRFQAFPGSGRDYPLLPGKTVVVAEQAIDHSAIYPGFPDMSHADFQFYWTTRALNPAVPTMVPIQLTTGAMKTMFLGPGVPFVATAVDPSKLERQHGRYQGDFVLFPRSAIVDLAVLYDDHTVISPTGTPYCKTLVHPSLDQLAAFVKPTTLYYPGVNHLLAAQRRVLPSGQHLQRTGTSAVDWEVRPRSPGKIP